DVRWVAVDERTDPQLFAALQVAQLVDELISRRPDAGRIGEVVDAGQKDEQPITLISQLRQRVVDAACLDRDPGVARADASLDDQGVRDHCLGAIPWALMRACRIISALSRSSGRGGQPGT